MYVDTHTCAHIDIISIGIFRMHVCSYTYICTHTQIKYWYFLHRLQGLGYYLSHIRLPLPLFSLSPSLSLAFSFSHSLACALSRRESRCIHSHSCCIILAIYQYIYAFIYMFSCISMYIGIYMHVYMKIHVSRATVTWL